MSLFESLLDYITDVSEKVDKNKGTKCRHSDQFMGHLLDSVYM